MKPGLLRQRNFLFLQGPAGPVFWMLGQELLALGCGVHRINLNGGDKHDWPAAAVDYRGLPSRWPLFIDRYLRDNNITDLMLFGDCRPMHIAARGMAKLRGVNVHVLEEGYIRPDWMTFEPDGVNGHSTLSRDARWFLTEARNLPPLPDLPPVTASFQRRARDGLHYYTNVALGRFRFLPYKSHRPESPIVEGVGWLKRFALQPRRARQTREALKTIEGKPYFVLPLQLSADYQIRIHSPFDTMQAAAEYMMVSFARHAPKDSYLVVKEHPLDSSFFNWRRFVLAKARALGMSDRILHVDVCDLAELSTKSRGMVCVNSTSGTLALTIGIPVLVLGEAIYNIPGITHEGHIDGFWNLPQRPKPEVYDAFKRVLYARCLIRGGVASQSAVDSLVSNVVDRLFNDPLHSLQKFKLQNVA
ncbi:capsular biosynthesis protein [Sphingobium phenoxybenzoativorans]|uniref:Capsular biosynthesis protein n=1 Tax=Sphingobium phenoxybenzoativorans TaxID=1592790 RepID=A0A975K4J3_9SPHN|nr:capsular biosynthesis protein [Sphingobium phenoxybenzoativorans]QUT04382.1 capsular biosynthesis protein [Sphingobium phenoxybenzoativorans]